MFPHRRHVLLRHCVAFPEEELVQQSFVIPTGAERKRAKWRNLLSLAAPGPQPYFCTGGTYSLGTAEPSPKKN
jgi:hypothetical protein